MDYTILKAELLLPAYTTPLLTDIEATDLLNLADIPAQKKFMSGAELIEQQDNSDYAALTDGKKAQWLALGSSSSLAVHNGGAVAQIVVDIWGGGSNTVTNLIAARSTLISRAAELGLPVLSSEGADVNHARTMP